MSNMTEEEVESEVRSVFSGPMGGRSDFRFYFIQPTGAGSRTLTLPSVSSSFCWTAQQVAKLGNYKQPIYILAKDNLICSESDVRITDIFYAVYNFCRVKVAQMQVGIPLRLKGKLMCTE